MANEIKFSDKLDGETQVEIPKEQRFLRTQAYDKSVSDVIDMLRAGDIILDPDYQRNYLWNNKRASLLIESILLNVPIPIIYVSEEDDSKWSVIDGLQRLHSLYRYFQNEFKLTGLEVVGELNGCLYSKLNTTAQRILRNGILRMILIFKESHPEIKYDIFMRLNKGSIELNEQELRNCLHRGGLNQSLKELVKNERLLAILNLQSPHKRMRDVEMVLRYFAVSEDYNADMGKMRDYKGNLRSFLNLYMETHKSTPQAKIDEYKHRFNETISKVYSVFGSNAFRKIKSTGEYDTSVNRAIADVIMVSFEKYSADKLCSNKDAILRAFHGVQLEDKEFYNSITYGTSDVKRFEYRLNKWIKIMGQILR